MSATIPTVPEPDEQFIDTFEQRLREGIRRHDLLEATGRRTGGTRRKGPNMLATVSLMLLSLVLGATGTFAVVHQDPAPQRELHLQKAEILLERAQVRLERHRADLAETIHLVEGGVADDTVAATHRRKVAQAEAETRRRELDLEETRITGHAPVDALTGPLVDGRDFIMQRLESNRETLELDARHAQAGHDRMHLLAEQGLVTARELDRTRADLDETRRALDRLETRIELRRSFLAGEAPAADVEMHALLSDTEAGHAQTQARLEIARTRLQRITELHQRGAVSRGELREARAAAREAESDLALAELQLEMIRRRLAAPAPAK